MCDWNEADYAEYLRWVEAATARARIPHRPTRRAVERTDLLASEAPALAVEA
jgi:hypothetical protein